MSKTLGLDLGTNSIGWAILDNEKEGNKIQDKGVLIFTEGVKSEKGQEKSKAAERTGFRAARRIKFRRKIRKYQTLLVLAKNEMCPLTIDEVKKWRKSNFKNYPTKPEFLEWLKTNEDENINPYFFRDKASRKKLNKHELGRALYHMAQRRGFLSNRLDQSDDNLIKSKKDEIQEIINNDSLNKIEIIDAIESVFDTYGFKEKKKKDCSNATEEKLWSIRYFIIKKLNDKKLTTKNCVKDIDIYINKPENLGAVQGNISELNTAIAKANCKTLGQYFWKLYQNDRNDSLNKIRKEYTSREEHYVAEFEVICEAQGLDGINETKKDPNERYSGIVKELFKAIFYQRPLKSQKGLIGKCSLEPNKTRCSISRPEYESFRMYSFINTIKLKAQTDENYRFLTEEERDNIKTKFFRKSKPTFTFEDIKNTLGAENRYNYKDNSTVSGCPTIASLINVFGNNWKERIYESYTEKEIRNRKTQEVIRQKTQAEVISDVWHVLSTFTSEEKLEAFAIEKLQLGKQEANKFSKIHLKKDYASLSLYAIKKILPYLEQGLLYSHAIFMANMNKVIKPERWNNQADRELIEKEIGEIIKKHQEQSKILFSVNGLLTHSFGENQSYSKEAENLYKNDVENQLKKAFGEKTWERKSNKETLFSEAFNIFIKQLKKEKHAAIKRIDEKIIEFLSDNDLLNSKATDVLYHPSDIEKFKSATIEDKDGNKFKGLGSPDIGSIKNPMAMKALHQLKKLINTLIIEGQIDENTKLNIELSRQLNDSNKRKAIKKWQDNRKELYEVYEKKIKELYKKETGKEIKEITNDDIEKFGHALEQRKDKKLVSKDDVSKYALWEEQKHICIYTGKTISLSSFLGTNPSFDIEHTLPRSRSWDNSQVNKTLCDKTFNQQKKGNKTPFELQMNDDILPRIQHWKDKYEALGNEIEKKKRQTKGATEKEQKDKLIQQRHYMQMEYDYWKGKHDRFVMEAIKEGFKNSQAVDIGIISKYARAYLKSVFNKVYSVKGEMVDQYRKAWGVNITKKDENGRTVKNRDNHIHHCIDAVTIASLNKYKYDKLAHVWGLEDKGKFKLAKKELENEKPWKTFTQDVRNLEKEVLIVHQNKDVLPIQTKRIERKRGKIQYILEYEKDNIGSFTLDYKGKKIPKKDINGKLVYKLNKEGKRIPKIQQGDTVRGSLHQDTFYGAIAKDKNGNIQKDENGNIKPNYVVRKELSQLKKSDIDKIVDLNIREMINQATKDGLIIFNKNGAKINGTIWQNKEKQIPIKKVRIYTPSVKSPLQDFKKHAKPFLSNHEYKRQFNVVNDENYCMAIYEGVNKKGKTKRDFEIVNNIDAGEYFRMSNKKHRKNHDLVPNPHNESNLPLKYILKKGIIVLMYDKSPDEIWELKNDEMVKRLYRLAKFDAQGRLTFRPHSEAKSASTLKEVYSVDFKNLNEQIRLQVSKLNILVEGINFKITLTGKIEKM